MDRISYCHAVRHKFSAIVDFQNKHPDYLHGKKLIIWWYGCLTKGYINKSQPRVAVLLREIISDDGHLGGFYTIFLNVDVLGIARLGSILGFEKGGIATKLYHRNDLITKKFRVDYSGAGRDFYSIGDHNRSSHNPQYLIQKFNYPILGRYSDYFADSWVVKFYLKNGWSVLVPCLELFTRIYGSSELRRVLLTYPWQQAETRLFSIPEEPFPDMPDKWLISLGRDMVNEDALFLASIKYDKQVELIAKSFEAQLQVQQGHKAFIKIPPWNSNTGMLKFRGVKLDQSKCFLALNIDGFECPDCPEILFDRKKYVGTDSGNEPQEGDEDKGRGAGNRTRQKKGNPNLSQENCSDHGGGIVSINEPELEIFNKPKITAISAGETREGGRKGIPGKDAKEYSDAVGGEPYGGKKGVKKMKLKAPAILESRGRLLDTWNAFKRFQKDNRELVKSVDYYIFNKGFVSNGPPWMISFPDIGYRERGHAWTHIHSYRNRGLLVIRICIGGQTVFVFEIEHKYDADGVEDEAFKGFACVMKHEKFLNLVIKYHLRELPLNNGCFDMKIASKVLKDFDTFQHNKSDKSKYIGQNIVKNIFKKMKVNIK